MCSKCSGLCRNYGQAGHIQGTRPCRVDRQAGGNRGKSSDAKLLFYAKPVSKCPVDAPCYDDRQMPSTYLASSLLPPPPRDSSGAEQDREGVSVHRLECAFVCYSDFIPQGFTSCLA